MSDCLTAAQEHKKVGNDAFAAGDIDKALTAWGTAAEILRQETALDPACTSLLVACLSNASQAYLGRCDYTNAYRFANEAILVEASHEKSLLRRQTAQHGLHAEESKQAGNRHFAEGKWTEARAAYDKAMESLYHIEAARSPLMVTCLSNAAQCCINSRNYTVAIAYAESALSIDPGHEKSKSRKELATEKKIQREQMLAQVSYGGDLLDHCEADWRGDRDVVLAAVSQYGCALRFAHTDLRGDRDIVMAAVKNSGDALRFADEVLRRDRDIVLAAVTNDGRALQYASDERMTSDRDIVLRAVASDGCSLVHAVTSLREDYEVVLRAVEQDGYALNFAAKPLQGAKDIVMVAVKQTGHALRYASAEMRRDREVVEAAVRQDAQAWLYADSCLRQDAELIRLANINPTDRMA